jgi:hypothetical protein
MEERPPGRPSGYQHSEKTRQKIKEALVGKTKPEEHRRKIGESLRGRDKTGDHRENISLGMLDVDGRCRARLAELKANYPGQEKFFEENEIPLLVAMRDIKSDKEIEDIKKYIETEDVDRYAESLSYQYSSSSIYAQEDVVIALLDAASYLRKFH